VKGMSAFSTPFIVSERLALSHPPRVSQWPLRCPPQAQKMQAVSDKKAR
jgi:hypothetical protein